MENITELNEKELASVSGGAVTEEQALALALEKAKLEKGTKVRMKKMQTDWEHGMKVYEIEFVHNGTEYEFEIDSETGDILKYEREFW